MINQEHQRAQELSSRAALCLQESRTGEAQKLFAEAARLEKLAFEKIPLNKTRTRGILAVSFAALLFKAGGYSTAEREILALLEDQHLSGSARQQLDGLLAQVRETGSGPDRALARA